MKKTLLTFSILLSSTVFNTFAVGGDNIIEIDSLSIEQLQAITNDVSKSEYERLDACKKLLNLSGDAIEETLFVSLNNTIKNLTKHTQDKNIKSEALHIFHSVIEPRLLEIAQNPNNETDQLGALAEFWANPEISTSYRDLLSPILLDLMQNAKDEDNKTLAFAILWHCKKETDSYLDKLISLRLNLIENELNENKKLLNINQLWESTEVKNTHRIRLTSNLLDLVQNTQNETTKYIAICMLLSDQKSRNEHLNALIHTLLDLAQNAKEETPRFYAITALEKEDHYILIQIESILRGNTHHNTLMPTLLDPTQNTKDEKNPLIAIITLENETQEKIIHYNDLKLDIVLNGSDGIIRDKAIDSILASNPKIITQHESILCDTFKKRLTEEPDNMNLKLKTYLMFGAPFQEEFDCFIKEHWPIMNNYEKSFLLKNLISLFGAENPRVKELLFLYAHEKNHYDRALEVYIDLLLKLEKPFTHNPNAFTLKIEGKNEKILRFAINPEIFDYFTIKNQEALATLDDIDFILGADKDITIKTIRNDSDFKSYFTAPFSEESIILQAMIKKFKKMGENGKKKLISLMYDMHQNAHKKYKAIIDHYLIESKSLRFAKLKNITDWLIRLKENSYLSDEDIKTSFNMSRNQLITLVSDMLKPNHIIRRYLTDLNTEKADLFKALLGSIIELEENTNPNDRKTLGETLKSALNILLQLSNSKEYIKTYNASCGEHYIYPQSTNSESFTNTLNKLCEAHQIYLPANAFDEQSSSLSFENIKKIFIKELINIKDQSINELNEKLLGKKYFITPYAIEYIKDLLSRAIGLRNPHKAPDFWEKALLFDLTSKSLQEILDLFHEDFTVDKIINYIEMLISDKFHTFDSETGIDTTWNEISIIAKEELRIKGIDESIVDLYMFYYSENGQWRKKLAMALFLTKLGILNEVDENGNPVADNNVILD
ncbi:MAG: hypothetical protein Q8S31_10200 [Alphaproteobacteria bacterium]|nr:hypothetical protein [Alphaproteobacteria bacterium]